MSAPLLLPDSRLVRHVRGVIDGFLGRFRLQLEPIFCANCGCDGGFVPTENMTFVFYLCDPCHERHGVPEGTYAVPDEVFFARVHEEQMEKYGRELSPFEMAEALKDDNNILAKLAKDRSAHHGDDQR